MRTTFYYQFCSTLRALPVSVGMRVCWPPGSTGSRQTPAHESPEARELQGQACGAGGEERQQTTRYTSATHRALPKQRLFLNSHFPNKTQLNQHTPRLHSSKHMQGKPTQLHGHHENVPKVAPRVFVWGWWCSHRPQGPHQSLWWLQVWGAEKERGRKRDTLLPVTYEEF